MNTGDRDGWVAGLSRVSGRGPPLTTPYSGPSPPRGYRWGPEGLPLPTRCPTPRGWGGGGGWSSRRGGTGRAEPPPGGRGAEWGGPRGGGAGGGERGGRRAGAGKGCGGAAGRWEGREREGAAPGTAPGVAGRAAPGARPGVAAAMKRPPAVRRGAAPGSRSPHLRGPGWVGAGALARLAVRPLRPSRRSWGGGSPSPGPR